MKKSTILLLIFFFFPLISQAAEQNKKKPENIIIAQSGCCSWHGGVCGCNGFGRVECCDGTTSPSCTCLNDSVDSQHNYKKDEEILLCKNTYVKPYVRSDGTYVNGHVRTTPNKSIFDNWSTKGNINPYTGKDGYKTLDLDLHTPIYKKYKKEIIY